MNENIFTPLIAALAFGFLGSLHCVGMCGPIAGALSMNRQKFWRSGLLIYQTGRIFTYAALGFILGLIGSTMEEIGGKNFQRVMAVFAGIFMAGFGLNLLGIIPDPLRRLTSPVISILQIGKRAQNLMQNPAFSGWFSIGLVNGLLPCGLVYAALAVALSSGSLINSVLTMVLFGIGTIPAMTLVPGLMRMMSTSIRGNFLRVVGLLMILYGVYTGFRGSHWMSLKHNHAHDHTQAQPPNPEKEFCSVNAKPLF
ncbi:MAG: sulfite exporter TauE/SafE family protein [Spirochaetia bacterium]|nr:sulfite exporter TauE/SafE family protein [Spirochaetia bacterium]